jgi:hypothetical protein
LGGARLRVVLGRQGDLERLKPDKERTELGFREGN